MKKLLGIVVLGFLILQMNSVANSSSIESYLQKGMTKKEVKKLVNYLGASNLDKTFEIQESIRQHGHRGGVFYGGPYRKFFPEYKTEILTHWYSGGKQTGKGNNPPEENFPYYVFENVTKPVTCKGSFFCRGSIGNGTLKAVVFSKAEALIAADLEYIKKLEEKIKKQVAVNKKAEEKRIAEEKKKAEEKRIAEEKAREADYERLEAKHRRKCKKGYTNPKGFEKGTPEYKSCIFDTEQQEIAKAEEEKRIAEENKKAEVEKKKAEEEMLKNLAPQERAEYKCINTFGFKKGSSKYTDCLFKLYTVELELEKMRLEHEVQVQRLALEREKVKAAQAQASAAKALTRAARAQAEAAYRSAIANENQAYQQRRQNAQQSINQGMKMLGGCSFGNC